MLRQYWRKIRKVARGAVNTYVLRRGRAYDARGWWDTDFYSAGLSDRQTIAPDKDPISARYHYCSIELLLLRHLFNHGFPIAGSSVLDVGSGAGHWIDFYLDLGSSHVLGIDLSESSVAYLRRKYGGSGRVSLVHGTVHDALLDRSAPFDVVSAIGVMFHITDDGEWLDTIRLVGDRVRVGGLFAVGGHFGLLDGVNLQINDQGRFSKRLRSKRRWKRALTVAGFSDIRFYRNRAYLWIDDPLPENNLLVATR